MRQTIECMPCGSTYSKMRKYDKAADHGEEMSLVVGFPRRNMFCDGCGEKLETHHLVTAVGVWGGGRRIPNIPGWEASYITPATPQDVIRYRQAQDSAKELRNDPA